MISKLIVQIAVFGRETVLVGIGKKGMGLLNELVEIRSELTAYERHSIDQLLETTDVAGKNIILIDDVLNRGDTMTTAVGRFKDRKVAGLHALVLVGREDRMNSLHQAGISVDAALQVEGRFFQVLFMLWVSPLLRYFRNGAIPNRPHRVYRFDVPSSDPDRGAYRLLSAITGLREVSAVTEIPAGDGVDGPVYHGTLEIDPVVVRGVVRDAATEAEIDQAKVRVFIAPTPSLHLHLCGIFWPIGGEGAPPEALTKRVAESILELIDKALTDKLNGAGNTLVPLPSAS